MSIDSLFREAWARAVADYRNGIINSECTLHSSLYSELRRLDPKATVLCEPQLRVERHGCYVPDIVMVADGSIQAIAEIKFVPHGYPVYEMDLQKLKVLAECGQDFRIMLDPSTGTLLPNRFALSSDCRLVFAAIGRDDAAAVDLSGLQQAMAAFGSRFLCLAERVRQ